MTEDNPQDDILVAGLDDWVSLAEAQGYVHDAMPEAEKNEIRSAAIDLIEQMVGEGLLEIGQLTPRFEAWKTSPSESTAKLRREWVVTTVEMDHGFDWWLCLTPRGKELAQARDAVRDSP